MGTAQTYSPGSASPGEHLKPLGACTPANKSGDGSPRHDLGAAATTLEALLGAHPEYGHAYGLLAEVYTRQGHADEAHALLKRRPPGP
ncbi:MAG TPA: tetratricopeptide repeat protein [Anaeromyxobacteraceae bacterium]|nr:tetratricopeptide repeat protein [Anaeromyxobacteraceae bacterium]